MVKLTGVLQDAGVVVNDADLGLHLEGFLAIRVFSANQGHMLTVWLDYGLNSTQLIKDGAASIQLGDVKGGPVQGRLLQSLHL